MARPRESRTTTGTRTELTETLIVGPFNCAFVSPFGVTFVGAFDEAFAGAFDCACRGALEGAFVGDC
jgi:hypothetical protein